MAHEDLVRHVSLPTQRPHQEPHREDAHPTRELGVALQAHDTDDDTEDDRTRHEGQDGDTDYWGSPGSGPPRRHQLGDGTGLGKVVQARCGGWTRCSVAGCGFRPAWGGRREHRAGPD